MVVIKNHKQVNLKDLVFTAGARFKIKFNKGGYSTFNQDNTVVKTGGFADSNYQDYV
jgi:hypothetical protein